MYTDLYYQGALETCIREVMNFCRKPSKLYLQLTFEFFFFSFTRNEICIVTKPDEDQNARVKALFRARNNRDNNKLTKLIINIYHLRLMAIFCEQNCFSFLRQWRKKGRSRTSREPWKRWRERSAWFFSSLDISSKKVDPRQIPLNVCVDAVLQSPGASFTPGGSTNLNPLSRVHWVLTH